MVYLDTGCLVKLYYPEPDSDLVAARSSGQAIVYTPLHALELTTALELKVFRKEATIGQAHAALGLVEEDLSAGNWSRLIRHCSIRLMRRCNSPGSTRPGPDAVPWIRCIAQRR